MQGTQEVTVFDASERVYIEKPGALCLVSSGSPQVAYLELWDDQQNTLAFTNISSGALVGAVEITIGSTPSSAYYLAGVAGYTVPANAVGGILLLDDGAGTTIAYNFAGTHDGSVGIGNGIATGRAGPVGFGPRLIAPAGTLEFGRFLH